MTSEAATDISVTKWPAVLVVALCGVAVAMNAGKVAIAMPELRGEFHLSLVSAGWVSSMFNMLALATALLFGLLGDRIGPMKMCFAGLAASVAGGIGAYFAGGENSLLLSRFAEGAGLVAVAVSAPALITAASSARDRRFTMSVWSAYMPAGVGLVMLLAPLALAIGGWRALWAMPMLLMAAAALAIYRARAAYHFPLHAGDHVPLLTSARQALAQPVPWLLAVVMGTWSLQHFALIIWLPTFLLEQRSLEPLTVALLTCLIVLVNVPGNLIGGHLLRQGYRRGSLVAFASVLTGLCGAGAFLDLFPDLARYGFCLLLSFIGGLIPASVLSSSATFARTPKQIATLQGMFVQWSNLGTFIGPPLIAMVVAASGAWSDALYVTGSAAALGIVFGLLARRRESRPAIIIDRPARLAEDGGT